MRTATSCSVALVFLILAAADSRAATPFDDLLKRIPEQANAVLVVDVQAAHNSPLGKKENWAELHRKTAVGGIVSAPPSVLRVAVGAQINPATLQNTWEVTLVQLQREISLADLTTVVSGSPDTMAGQRVVLSPQNAFFVPFEPRVVGMMRPADRQATARWVRSAGAAKRVGLPYYLYQTIENMPRDAQALMAFDLDDVLDAEGLRQRFKKAKSVAGKGLDVEQLTKLFMGLHGVTVTLRVTDAINGEIRLDFTDPPTLIATAAKPLLLEALDAMGAGIDDLDDWQSRVSGKSIILSGKLSEEGMRKILSPLVRPAPMNIMTSESAGGKLSTDPKAAASQRYFHSVQSLLNDLKQQKAKTFQQLAYWHNQFAEKIDALPMLNVDEDLLKYGSAVSTTLRGLANLASGTYAAQKAAVNKSGEALIQVPNAYNYYGYGPGWGFGVSLPGAATINNYGMTNNMIARSGQTESALRLQTWKNIDAASQDIRRQMVQKYQVEF
jgi:hypothetical protein